MEVDGKLLQEAGFGDGPVDATFKTIKKITRTKSKLLQFAINAITSGTEAQGEVTVRLEEKGIHGHRPGRGYRCDRGQCQGLYQCPQQDGIQKTEVGGDVNHQIAN